MCTIWSILSAIVALAIVAFFFELTIALFFGWLLFCLISFVLGMFGLQQYAPLVFILYLLFGGWWRRW